MVKSIYELSPLDISGRHARNGFEYQDHVGANFCLEMLIGDDLKEIWFETHDDITLIWKDKSGVRVEFVQVKAHNPASRWSVANITLRDNGQGSSLLEKSLLQHRCRENASFRVVTSYDIHGDLEILKHHLDSQTRINGSQEIDSLVQKIQGRFNGDVILSESGKDVKFWVDNCLWDKKPDSLSALENENRLLLEAVFKRKRKTALAEHRDELYKKLLGLVKDASSKDLLVNPGCYTLTCAKLHEWFDTNLSSLTTHSGSDNPLWDKMQDAGLPNPILLTAEDLHWRYREARLDPDYYGGTIAFRGLEDEIMSLIPKLQLKQYGQTSSFDPLVFHNFCIEEVYKVVERDRLQAFALPEHIAAGFFYQVTNRCLMRFTVDSL